MPKIGRHDPDEGRAYGRSCRKLVARSDHATWDPKRRRHDLIEVILASTAGCIPALIPLKMARMATSPFGFFRGSVPMMAADLETLPYTQIPVQICGDAHVRNLGAFAAPDGQLIFDINDFDETIHGPWEWDLKRLAVSLILAGREAQNGDRVCREAVRVFVGEYHKRMLAFSDMPALEVARYRVHRPFEGRPETSVLHKAERATPQHNIEHLTVARRHGTRVFKDQKPLLVHPPKATVTQVLAALGPYRQTLAPERRHLLDCYRPADVVFKVVGTGSVATHDYVVLCFGNGPDDPLFLQLKEASPSAYAVYVTLPKSPRHQGRRVVEGQRRLQTQSDPLLGWTSFGGRDYLVRQLSDHKGTIDDDDLHGDGLMHYARTCGEVLAKGHARAGDPCLLAGYLGASHAFARAIERFAIRYADQTTKDYDTFRAAIRRGQIRTARRP